MAETHYACPDCGSIDLEISGEGLRDVDDKSLARAECPNCAWAGALKDTVGFATTENVFTAERLGEVMLRVSAKHAAGPLVQVLEWAGLLPPVLEAAPPAEATQGGEPWTVEDLERHNELAQQMRNEVMRATFEAFITASFEKAAEMHRIYAVETNTPLHPIVRDEGESETFGLSLIHI